MQVKTSINYREERNQEKKRYEKNFPTVITNLKEATKDTAKQICNEVTNIKVDLWHSYVNRCPRGRPRLVERVREPVETSTGLAPTNNQDEQHGRYHGTQDGFEGDGEGGNNGEEKDGEGRKGATFAGADGEKITGDIGG